MDEKKKKILKGVGIGVLALAVVGTAIGIGFSVSNKEKEPDEPIINKPVEPEPKPVRTIDSFQLSGSDKVVYKQ